MYSEQALHPTNLVLNPGSERNPDEWITGTEPMTADQRHLLKILCQQAGENFDGSLSKPSAIERIKTLQDKINRIL